MIKKQPRIKIREAKRGDLKEVAELKIKFTEYERKFDKKIKVWPKKDNVTFIKKKILGKNKGKIFVAIDEDSNKIVGYCYGWIQRPDWLEYKGRKYGYVGDCFLLKKYRGKGIGPRLVKDILKWLKSKKIRIFFLEVYLKNKKAYKVWKKMGFKELEITMRKSV